MIAPWQQADSSGAIGGDTSSFKAEVQAKTKFTFFTDPDSWDMSKIKKSWANNGQPHSHCGNWIEPSGVVEGYKSCSAYHKQYRTLTLGSQHIVAPCLEAAVL